MMDRVGIRDLRAPMRRPSCGERAAVNGSIITVAGRPLAQLGPLDPLEGPVTVDDLVARGLLLPPRRSDRPKASAAVPTYSATRLDRLLRDVR